MFKQEFRNFNYFMQVLYYIGIFKQILFTCIDFYRRKTMAVQI